MFGGFGGFGVFFVYGSGSVTSSKKETEYEKKNTLVEEREGKQTEMWSAGSSFSPPTDPLYSL